MEAADQGDWQPEVVIEINAGDNSVSYREEADYNILTNEVYRINDLAFETGNGILYPEDQVKVFIMFEVDTPGDWEFGLQAASYIQFEVEWSLILNLQIKMNHHQNHRPSPRMLIQNIMVHWYLMMSIVEWLR